MKYIIFLLLAMTGWALAADFQQAKVLDVRVATAPNNSALGRWAASDGGSVVIPSTVNTITVTLSLGDFVYTAQYRELRHFKASDLVIGDSAPARVDGDKLILKGSDGKEVKGKIIRKARS